MTLRRWSVSNESEHMDQDYEGGWVSFEDYEKLQRLIKVCAENLTEYVHNTRGEMDELEEAVLDLTDALEGS